MSHRVLRVIVTGLTLAAVPAGAQTVRTIPLSRTITLDGLFPLADGSLLGASAYAGTTLWHIDTTGTVEQLAAGLAGPIHVVQDRIGNRYLSNYSDSGTIARVSPQGVVTRFATVPQGPAGMAIGPDGLLYVAIYGNAQGSGDAIYRVDAEGRASVFASGHGLSGPIGLAFDDRGDLYAVNGRDGLMFRISSDGAVRPFASLPAGPGFFSAGHLVYAHGPFFVSGNSSQVVYLVMPDGSYCVFAGRGTRGTRDGPAREAEFIVPNGLAVAADGRTLFVAHGGGGLKNTIRRIDIPPADRLRCN